MYDAITIADEILKIAKAKGKCLTPMQLMKLTYIAHGWALVILQFDLFNNRIEAWKYGPVIPNLYHATKSYGRRPIPLDSIGDPQETNVSAQVKTFLESVFERYGQLDGIQLSALTHKSGTPWDAVYRPNVLGIEIPDQLIRKHYSELLSARQAA